MTHKVIRHSSILVARLGLGFRVADGFVIVVALRVDGDDVPCVQEAGEVAEHAEEDIDEGVRGADARFDPDCEVVS